MLIIFLYLFPQILNGKDPLITTLIASILILFINIPLSHGLSKITFMALLGTIGGLFSSVFFAKFFMYLTNLSGLANENAIYFYWSNKEIDPRGILLAAIILGVVGVFDDVSITQAEAVEEIYKANPKITQQELFSSVMRIGRHHIASMVNTLVLAYVAVSMPLFLLFLSSSATAIDFLNIESVVEEIVRTLAGTSALVLTVPLTSWLASYIITRKKKANIDARPKREYDY